MHTKVAGIELIEPRANADGAYWFFSLTTQQKVCVRRADIAAACEYVLGAIKIGLRTNDLLKLKDFIEDEDHATFVNLIP